MPANDPTDEILQLNQRLLDAIATGDWATYEELCDPALTAFEPEARGHRVEDATPTAPTMARRIHLDR